MNGEESYRPFRLEIRGILTLSAFHVGTGQRLSPVTDAPILLDTTGRPYLPASSLRGILRSHLERESGLLGGSIDLLFGPRPQRGGVPGAARLGRLIVYDATPDAPIVFTEVRDHVKVSLKTGGAEDGAKYDAEVACNARLRMTLIYEGESETDAELALVQEALHALRAGDLTCGAKAGWGYGRLILESSEVFFFDRRTSEGMAQWLDFRLNGKQPASAEPHWPLAVPCHVESTPLSWVEFVYELAFDGPCLVRAPIPSPPTNRERDATNSARFSELGQEVADHVFITTGTPERPYLPGSSLRGMLRHQSERIVRTMKPDGNLVDELFGCIKHSAAENGRKGRIEVGDGELSADASRVYLDHVAIDRVTGFAADKKKFSTCALESPRFHGRLRVQFTDGELALLALAGFVLRDLEDGWLWCGGGATRGYGHIHSLRILNINGDLVASLAPPVDTLPTAARTPRAGRMRFHVEDPAFHDLNWLWTKAEAAWIGRLPVQREGA